MPFYCVPVILNLGLGNTCWHAINPIYWLSWVEGKYRVYCRAPSKEKGQIMLKRPRLPKAFQGRVLKAMWGKGLQGTWSDHARFRLAAIKVKFWVPPFLWFQLVGSTCLRSALFIWWVSDSWKTTLECVSDLIKEVWHVSVRKLEVQWLCYVAKSLAVSLPNSCPFFPHLLIC